MSTTVDWFDRQSVQVTSSVGYQFIVIILDIGSTEIASAVRVTYTVIHVSRNAIKKSEKTTFGKKMSSRLPVGAWNWRGLTRICDAALINIIKEEATRAIQYRENLMESRSCRHLWTILESYSWNRLVTHTWLRWSLGGLFPLRCNSFGEII